MHTDLLTMSKHDERSLALMAAASALFVTGNGMLALIFLGFCFEYSTGLVFGFGIGFDL